MGKIPNWDEAMELLKGYNEEAFHLRHGEIVGGVMGYFAQEYAPDEVEFWRVVGLLHDLDFERYPAEHCVKGQELMRDAGLDERIVRACASHGWGLVCDVEPVEMMEKILFATDELTGLIGAAAIMRPSKSVVDIELSSMRKKFKDKKFAAGCSRDVIRQGAELLGWELDELLQRTIDAMRSLIGKIEGM